MSEVSNIVGTCIINSKTYRMVRDGEGIAYTSQLAPEPPWDSGEPLLIRDPQFTWHQGAFKSREGIPGTYEYSRNLDSRFIYEIGPSPAQTDLTLTSSASTPTSIFEAFGYLFVCCGRRLYRIDPSDNSVLLSHDFGGSENCIMGLLWEGVAYVTTDHATTSLFELALGDIGGGSGGNADDWDRTSDVFVYRLAAGINRLFGIDKTGILRNIISGLDPITDANWADSVQVGDTATIPTSLVAYERTVFVGKPEGMFGVGDDGFGLPLVTRMARDTDNCAGMTAIDPWVFIPHVRGLYRYVPGTADAFGLTDELLNKSGIEGRWRGFTSDDRWVYGILDTGTDSTYIIVLSPVGDNAISFGPYILNTWLYFTAESRALHVSALNSPNRLWFGKGVNLSYIQLDGSTYSTSGQFFTYESQLQDKRAKDFPRFEVEGEGLDKDTYYDIYYSIDGGAYSNNDVDSNAMRLDSNGLSTFYLPTTAVGRRIRYRFDYTGKNTSAQGKITYFCPFASPQSQKTQVVSVNLLLEENIWTSQGPKGNSALAQLLELQTLAESAGYVSTSGPWGEAVQAKVVQVRVASTSQALEHNANFIAQVALSFRGVS